MMIKMIMMTLMTMIMTGPTIILVITITIIALIVITADALYIEIVMMGALAKIMMTTMSHNREEGQHSFIISEKSNVSILLEY